MQKIQKHYFFI